MKEKIYFREKYLRKIRPFYDSDIVKVITGIRRCGKSFILKMIMEELYSRDGEKRRIVYLPLDKKGYKSIATPSQLEEAIDSQIKDDGPYHIFIDEVQNVPGFEKIVLAYQEEGHSVFLTGSNSYLLSDEISTKLTGRYISFEVFTLDFSEYLGMKRFRGLPLRSNEEEFEEYLRYGGFPKSLEFPEQASRTLYVQSIIDEILVKDIKKRRRISHVSVFERVQSFLVANYGQAFSLKNIYNYFRIQEKVAITEKTLRTYIDILKKAKIIYECNRFDCHSKRALRGEQKYYLADPSIFFALTQEGKINYGPALENAVYLFLRGIDCKVSVGLIGKWECDFVAVDPEKTVRYIQVSRYIGDDENAREREYRPFRSIKDSFPRYILSMDRLLDQQEGVKHLNIIDTILKNAL